MERIGLSKDEKKVLRLIVSGSDCPDTFARHIFSACVRSLERKGLVKGAYVEGGSVQAARLTSEGRTYLAENPTLSNPKDWKWWATWVVGFIASIGGLAGFIALLRTCN